MPATTPIQICNEAIALVGGHRILSMDEAGEEARLCKLFYDNLRDALLRSHRWNFARTRVELGRLADAPAFGWDYAYQLPADCLRVLEFNGSETTDETADDYEIEGTKLLSDAETANIVYTKQITDTVKMDALFIRVLALQLGAAISRKLSGSETLGAKLLGEASAALIPARRVDSGEPRSRRRPWPIDSDFVNARYR